MEEEMFLKDDNGKDYIFKLQLEEDSIHFYLKENKVYAPFTFESFYTLDQIIKLHKAFKACDDLEEVYKHLLNLYKRDKMALMDVISSEKLLINCRFDYISVEDTENIDIIVEKKMTEEKDRDLLELYKIQKKQLETFKKIKKMVEKGMTKENPLYKEIFKIIEQCRSKV